MSTKGKLRITQSLLSAWEWSFKTDTGYSDFLDALSRKKKPLTSAMLDGIRYENCLNSILNGEPLYQDNGWFDPLCEMACELHGAQQQVVLFKDIEVDGQRVLLHGVLDYLREGHIWDCKFSKRYSLNKYLSSPQHPMYLDLVPEAMDFTYIITDGKYVYRERYPRDIVPSIEPTIRMFFTYLEQQGLWEIYEKNWSVSNG